MRLHAEIHCYLCGEVSGTWEWLAASGPRLGILRTLHDDDPRSQGPFARVRCSRCGGPVYLDVVEPVRVHVLIPAEGFRARQGRPPKRTQRLVS